MFVYYRANHAAANKVCVVLLYKHNFRQNYIQKSVRSVSLVTTQTVSLDGIQCTICFQLGYTDFRSVPCNCLVFTCHI